MIDERRLCGEFAELVAIDSPSFGERKMADRVKEKLSVLGFQVYEDKAGGHYGSDTGNVYGFLKGTIPGDPILLSAHLDTVPPAVGKKAVFHEDGRITGSGDTVLGSDDIAGIVEILEGIRHLQEENIPHRDVEVLFPIAEEVYIKGTEVFDFSRVRAKEAYVLDLSGAPGTAAVKAPSLISFRITVRGKASHAGFAPEEGIHAIQVMSRAVSRLPLGYVDGERDTTLNVGVIRGGNVTNIVPDICTCEGEIRSLSHEKALAQVEVLKGIFQEESKRAGVSGQSGSLNDKTAEVSVETHIDLTAYETDAGDPVVKRFEQACARLGLPGTLTTTFGGSDNNNFARHGIRGIVLSCGMNEVHSVREYTTVQELKTGAKLVAELLKCRLPGEAGINGAITGVKTFQEIADLYRR